MLPASEIAAGRRVAHGVRRNPEWLMARRAAADRSGAAALGQYPQKHPEPALKGVEGDDPNGVVVLTVEQIDDYGFQIGCNGVGFPTAQGKLSPDLSMSYRPYSFDVTVPTSINNSSGRRGGQGSQSIGTTVSILYNEMAQVERASNKLACGRGVRSREE
jgi:hypothetical protein